MAVNKRLGAFGSMAKSAAATSSAPSPSADPMESLMTSGAFAAITYAVGRRLYSTFGSGAAKAVEDSDPRAKAILGARFEEAKRDVTEHKDGVPLLAWLTSKGLSGTMAKRALAWTARECEIKMTPSAALYVWTQNPYGICEVPGMGFARADKIALASGFEPGGEPRLVAACAAAVKKTCEDAGGGALVSKVLFEAAKNIASNGCFSDQKAADIARDTAMPLAEKKGVSKTVDHNGSSLVFSADFHLAEEEVAERLLLLSNRPKKARDDLDASIARAQTESGITLTDEQRSAISTVVGEPVSIICGKPGAGKTTLLRCACKILEETGAKIIYAAPTGKAAKRMRQALGKPAHTIHRVLGFTPQSIERNKRRKRPSKSDDIPLLEADAIVIDEASMLDVMLFRRLLRSMGPNTALILIGDPAQLPSVGPGKALFDMISSGSVPVATLSKTMRQSSGSAIVSVARAISEGTVPDFSDKSADCLMLEHSDASTIAARVSSIIAQASAKYHPIRDTQILTPGKNGPAGSLEMNEQLQAMLNPPSHSKGEITSGFPGPGQLFRLGDKVMQRTNDYERILFDSTDPESDATGAGVFNGDCGYVERIDGQEALWVRLDDGCAKYSKKEAFSSLDLSYACTVHKFQGSESPVVITLCHESTPKPLRNRNLFYTAITRAKNKCIVIGSPLVLEEAAKREALDLRITRLRGLLDATLSFENPKGDITSIAESRALARLVGDLEISASDLQGDTFPPVKRKASHSI